MDNADYISEFEDLLKLKEFYKDRKMKMAFLCTYEEVVKALKDEYTENIKEKIKRWVDVTHIMYFENVQAVTYYLQAKMLYRDGFYEASISLSRTVCEMICYDLLSKTPHPFGDIELIEVPTFRLFVGFLAMPKKIQRSTFEQNIIAKISEMDDKNLVKSHYELDKSTSIYNFKTTESPKTGKLRRIFKIFEEVGFDKTDNFKKDTHQYLNDIYDIANKYVHAKANKNLPKENAFKCLNMLTYALSDIYEVKALVNGKRIKTGYADFPDICKGMNFAIEYALTPDDAEGVYHNFPTQEQFELLMQNVGVWSGEWKNEKGESQVGTLTFYSKEEGSLYANLDYNNVKNEETTEPMDIRLFGNYFHLIGFDMKDKKHKKSEHVAFELELFNAVIQHKMKISSQHQ